MWLHATTARNSLRSIVVRLPLFPPSAKVVLRHVTTEQLIYAGFTLLLIGLSANNARGLILPNIITVPRIES